MKPPQSLRVLHLDDDLTILDRFSEILNQHQIIAGLPIQLTSVDNVEDFKQQLKGKLHPDVVLVDVHLAGERQTGVDMARLARDQVPYAVILVISSTRDSSVIRAGLKAGADDFVSKDVEVVELVTRLEAGLENNQQQKKSAKVQEAATDGSGKTMASIKLRIPDLVKSAVNCIYIEGESGTGKEVAANLVAQALPKGVPFVRVNCGAIAPSLLTSELFGHTKGSFTGALIDKPGLLEAADGGWIFLDEVATLPADAQVALLRAIDNQAIRRVGATVEKTIHFRVISATNEPLHLLVEAGKFRKDLWQRLRETHITIPPLRERKQEIPELINFFLSSMRGGPYQLAPTVQETLVAYDWSEGNVRELRNVLRAMTEKAIAGLLTPKSIPERIWEAMERPATIETNVTPKGSSAHSQICLSWQGNRPPLEHLTQMLLAEILRQEHREHGLLSLRGLGKSLGVAKSTVATRIKGLIEDKLMQQDELNRMLKMSTLKEDE